MVGRRVVKWRARSISTSLGRKEGKMKAFTPLVLRAVLPGLCLVVPATVAAAPMIQTVTYDGDDFHYDWVFSFSIPGGLTENPVGTISFEPDPSKHPNGRIAGLQLTGTWHPQATFTQVEQTVQLAVSAQHVIDPHIDVFDEGERVSFTVKDILDLPVTAGSGFQTIDLDFASHVDSQGNHTDEHVLLYRRPRVDDWEFEMEGLHLSSMVPEPTSLGLGAVAAMIGLGYAWRHRRATPRAGTPTDD
jgi:hypothetical protein